MVAELQSMDDVQVETSRTGTPQGLSVTGTVGPAAPPAGLLMAPSHRKQSAHWREGDVIQRDLGGGSVYKAECKILPLGQGDSKHKHRPGGEWIESSPEEGDLVLVNTKLNMSQ